MSTEHNFDEVRADLMSTAGEVKSLVERQDSEIRELKERVEKAELAKNRPSYPYQGKAGVADRFVESDNFAGFKAGNLDRAYMEVKEITPLLGSDNIVWPDQDPDIYAPAQRNLRVADLMPSLSTDSNLVHYTQETDYTAGAAEQATEGAEKGESDFTFAEKSAPVVTVAHHMTVSKQSLEDRSTLQQHLDSRMMYFLGLKVEELLLHGDGQLDGLDQPGNHVEFEGPLGDTDIDTILNAQAQLQATDNQPSGIILHPSKWRDIRAEKDSQNRYLHGFPNSDVAQRLWGLNVVVTPSINDDEFIIGDFARGAIIRDRQNMSIEMSRMHNSNFTKNLVTLLAEVRLALTVVRPSAIVFGNFETLS